MKKPRINFRMDPEVVAELKKVTRRKKVTMTEFVTEAVRRALKAEQ